MWSFLAHLRERKLAHWAVAYLAGAWLLLQVLGLLAQPFAWPALVLRAAIALLAVGFFAVLILAWYHGEKGAQRVTGIELIMLAGILVIAGAAVAFVGRGGRGAAAPATSSDSKAPAPARTAIAVLPFDNLSAEGQHFYFAGGLHDELITQLAKVKALAVRGRPSVMGYAGTTKSIGEIGADLSVGTIVEGSVQIVADRLRVNVQLIDAATDEHLWAEHYDRTLDDAFAVQSDIAQQIVAAIGTTLDSPERTAISAAPTDKPEAYRLYLQGQDYWRRPGQLRRNWEIAQNFYERAVALDSSFALAYAALSEVHGRMSWHRYDPSPERLQRQREAAETALRLAPDLPQAHLAMGEVHYRGRRDWQAALREYRIALEGLPNDAALWARIASVNRRLGNWDEVFAALGRVVVLDPRNANALWDLGGGTLLWLRRYREAVEWFDRALALAPDLAGADVNRGWIWVPWQGHLDSVTAALARHPPDAELGYLGSATVVRARVLYWERKPDSLLALLDRTSQPALEGLDVFLPTALYQAWAHRSRGNEPAARRAFDSALVLLDSMVLNLPDDWRLHAARGLALAGLGRQREAEREAAWLQRSDIYRDDAFTGPNLAEARAAILASIGEADAALAEIERLLSEPSDLSVHSLRLDPGWDPIRRDRRFQALLVKYANPQPVH